MSVLHDQTIVLVGALTQPVPFCPGASGDGIVTLSLDPSTGRLERRHHFRDLLNPSFLAWAKGESRLYAAEADFDTPGRVFALEFSANGRLSLTGTAPLNGSVACHVCMLPHNSGICIASYLNSCIDTFALHDGKIVSPRSSAAEARGSNAVAHTHRYHGSGPHAARQEASHAHQALVDPAGRHLYVCDLGSDCLWIHQLVDGIPVETPISVKVPAGYGPRHIAFHPKLLLAYVLCELSGRVLAYSCAAKTGGLTLLADVPGLPADWHGEPAAAAIHVHPSGQALYASQRTHNSLAVFRLGSDGIPTPVQHLPSGGKEPRDFDIDSTGRWIIIANQSSNNLTVYEVDPATGLPTTRPMQQFAEGSPACVVSTNRPFQP